MGQLVVLQIDHTRPRTIYDTPAPVVQLAVARPAAPPSHIAERLAWRIGWLRIIAQLEMAMLCPLMASAIWARQWRDWISAWGWRG